MSRTLLAALTLPLILASLIGCVRTVAAPVDPVLSRDCERPEMRGETWRDLAEAYYLRGEAIDECNARMRAIRNAK